MSVEVVSHIICNKLSIILFSTYQLAKKNSGSHALKVTTEYPVVKNIIESFIDQQSSDGFVSCLLLYYQIIT